MKLLLLGTVRKERSRWLGYAEIITPRNPFTKDESTDFQFYTIHSHTRFLFFSDAEFKGRAWATNRRITPQNCTYCECGAVRTRAGVLQVRLLPQLS